MLDKLKRAVVLLALGGVAFFTFPSPAAAWECPRPHDLKKVIEPRQKESIVPWGPDGAGVLVTRSLNHRYVLYFHIEEEVYCPAIQDAISQIRILDSCPDGVERELPCIELVEYDTDDDPKVLKNGQCTAWFNVYAADEYGDYERIKRYRPVFDCRDLDKLPELGLIPPGRIVLRDFQETEWEAFHPQHTQRAKDLYPELFQPEK